MTGSEALAALITTLEQLKGLLPTDKAGWDRDAILQLAVERLWITTGNLAEVYRTKEGLSTDVDPWAELVGYRHLLAHAVPGDVSTDRVYADTTADLDRILSDLRQRQL